MSPNVDVAVIGAGPYGLSLVSHLRHHGLDVRVFGVPMQTWRQSMPVGMSLKSEGFASNISDPAGELTLETYCRMNAIPYAHTGLPVKVDIFANYGDAFQKRFIAELERKMVVSLEAAPNGFDLRLDSGEALTARRVVVASGITAFAYVPPELRGIPRELITHSVAYGDAFHLAGRDVLVVGAGASATDVAGLLKVRGAKPTIVTRKSAIRFQTALGERSLSEKIKAPMTGLGPGWKSVLCVKAPLLFHAMPEPFRVDVVRRYLGPAPGWFIRQEIEGHVPCITQSTITGAAGGGSGVRLSLRHADGSIKDVFAEHVVAATGYRVDVDRLTFIGKKIRASLRRADSAPALSRNFESSMPHLYFIGTASANSFGPMMRFAYGAEYTARRLSRHLANESRRPSASRPQAFSTLGAVRS